MENDEQSSTSPRPPHPQCVDGKRKGMTLQQAEILDSAWVQTYNMYLSRLWPHKLGSSSDLNDREGLAASLKSLGVQRFLWPFS